MKRCLLMVVLAAISAAGLWGQTLITLPDDYYRLDELEGTVVELRQRMYVVDNSSWNRYGEVTLASERLQSPTEVALPGSAEYFELVEHNASCCIVLDDANTAQYPSPRPWASADGTLRTGAYTDYVKGRLTKEKWGYTINPLAVSDIVFEGNERPAAPADMGECDVTICGFNLQYYMVDEFDGKMGPADQEEADRQHAKIMAALTAIGADIYGLVEVQQGKEAACKIVDALNLAFPDRHYAYISDGTRMNGSWTRACFIYRDDILATVRDQQTNDTGVRYRKKAQGFEVKASGERFVVMLGHFKAKSGSGQGDNADNADGQGTYNGDRVREATAMTTLARSCATYYSDPDIVMIGDLNSYSQEDPIRVFADAGFVNMIKRFGEEEYSYRYRDAVGCLDHALANASMAGQITGCAPFHINTDEPKVFAFDGSDYRADMYRSSDHDPIVIGIKPDRTLTATGQAADDLPIVYSNSGIIGVAGAESRTLEIIDLQGRVLGTYRIDSADFTLSTEGLEPGIYLLRITTETESTTHKAVVYGNRQ